jgi:hypothetical protein
MNRLSTVSTGAYEAAETGVDESGQATLQAEADPQRQHLGRAQAILLDTRLYDGASRLVRSGPAGSLPLNYAGALVEGNANLSGATTTFTGYDPAGRVLYRSTINEADRSHTSIDYRQFSTTRTE